MLATPELLLEAAHPRRLAAELERCADQIPLYRRTGPHKTGSESAHLTNLRSWPIITKKDIREGFPANFLDAGADLDELIEQGTLELEHTSGTSEERTPLLLPIGWWTEQEHRALRLNASVAKILDLDPHAKRATINSPVCSGEIRYSGVPSHDNRIVGNALFVSLSRYPFLWSEHDLARIAGEILEWEPAFLDVDPVYGVVFARYCERNKIRLPSLRFILCSYEFVSLVHRSILQRAFGVPVLDLYGSTETGHLLMEDEEGRMRPSLETAYLELVDVDTASIGELVVTTLSNPIMPLIRYRIGDLVERHQSPYGVRYILHGRTADSFRLPNGARVTTRQVDQCLGDATGIAHYQLVQREAGRWLLRFVPDGQAPDAGTQYEIQERVSQLLQSITPIEMQPTDMLGPEKSGKFRLGYPLTQKLRGANL